VKFFKIAAAMQVFAVFCFVSVLHAQVNVADETRFMSEMSGANPNFNVSSSINFTQSFPDTVNKNANVSLSAGVILDGRSLSSAVRGFNLIGSTLTFNFGASNSINGFAGAFTSAAGSIMNFNGSNIAFRQNAAVSGGGVFNISGASEASLVSNYILFSLNTSSGSGGAVNVSDGSLFEITASTILFRNGSAEQSAGAIYAVNGSTVNLGGGYMEFVGNSGKGSGGALHIGSSYFNIGGDTVIFENNSSKDSGTGGAVYGSDAVFDLNGQDVSFLSNNAAGSGGALYAAAGSVFNFNSVNTDFAGNESGNMGGGVYSESGSKFTFNGDIIYFDINKSAASGGAVYAAGGSEFIFSSSGTYFQYNLSADGGAISGNDASFTFSGGETYFTGNNASSSGGAVYAENRAVFNFISSANVFRYNTAADGGAIYMADSDITIDNALFLNNTAVSGLGGAVYMSGFSTAAANLNINAVTGDVLFRGNTASGKANDIYMNEYGNIVFDASSGRTITLEGGISAKGDSGNSIVKLGAGTLEFAGNHSDYRGGLIISAGTLAVKNDAAVTAGNFEIGAGGKYSTVNGQGNQVTAVGHADIKGEYEIDVDFASYKADKLIAVSGFTSASDGKVDLANATGSLNITAGSSLGFGTSRITLIEAENGVAGTFASDNFSSILSLFPAGTTAYIDYSADKVELYVSRLSSFYAIAKMTHNQKEVASTLDEASKANTTAEMSAVLARIDALANDSLKKSALNRLSGSFIANALTAGALRSGITELYERVQPRYCPHDKISKSLWGQIYLSNNKFGGDENTAADFGMNGYGIQAGFDLFTGENSLGGFYISYGHNALEQDYDEADMQDYGLGFYGGWFGENIDIKASLSGTAQNFDLKRNIKFAGLKTNADFNTYGIRADGQIEFKTGVGGDSFELRPFAGLQGGYIMNEKIEEKNGAAANLIIESGDYLRLTALGGAAINGISEKFNWYGKVYAGYIITGTRNEFDGKFADSGGKINIYGTEIGALGVGAGAGIEYNLTKQWSLYANANTNYAEKASGYYGNIGVNYRFCTDASRGRAEKISPAAAADDAVSIPETVRKEEEIEIIKHETPEENLKEDNNEYYVSDMSPALETISAAEPKEEEKDAAVREVYVKPEEVKTQDYPVSGKTENIVRSDESAAEPKEEKAAAAREVYVKPEEVKTQDYPVSGKTENIVRSADEPRPAFEETASFVSGDYELENAEKNNIRRQIAELKRIGYKKIVVRGHTDSAGSEAVNNRLSLQRAKAVYEELIAGGIDPDKIEYVGYADRKPVAENDTEEGMALNRRTDIVVDEPAIVPGVIYTASYFITYGYSLSKEVKNKIKQQTDEIKQTNYNEIIIEGHADSTGSDRINDPLSRQRAETVYDEFIENGIPAGKMTYTGYGSRRPIDTNATKEGRANNRRVEVTVK